MDCLGYGIMSPDGLDGNIMYKSGIGARIICFSDTNLVVRWPENVCF